MGGPFCDLTLSESSPIQEALPRDGRSPAHTYSEHEHPVECVPGHTSAPSGRFKQAPGAAPCPGGPSVRGSCTGWRNNLLAATRKGEEKGRSRQGGRGFVHPRTNIAGRGPQETSYREAMTQAIVGGSEVQQAATAAQRTKSRAHPRLPPAHHPPNTDRHILLRLFVKRCCGAPLAGEACGAYPSRNTPSRSPIA